MPEVNLQQQSSSLIQLIPGTSSAEEFIPRSSAEASPAAVTVSDLNPDSAAKLFSSNLVQMYSRKPLLMERTRVNYTAKLALGLKQ